MTLEQEPGAALVPLLFNFRFHDPRHAVSRVGFVLLDTALDYDRYASLAASGAVALLRRGTTLLLRTLDAHFPTPRQDARPLMEIRVTRQAFAAVQMSAKAGIAVRHDEVDDYVGRQSPRDALAFRLAPR